MATAKTTRIVLDKDDKDQALPFLVDGEMAQVSTVTLLEKKTRPPALYTEGTLLDDMRGAAKFVEADPEMKKLLKDVSGLGTAATRDSIIETLKFHKYLEKSGKHIVATEKGEKFILWLDAVIPEVTNVAVTARWEAELAIVAEVGGGKAFEDRVAQKVRDMISTFKTAPALGFVSTNQPKESPRMSDTETKRSNTPSDKMLEFAKNIATKVGVRVPDEVMVDWDACKKFIDDNKEVAMRPSEKQLNFANKIAQTAGVAIPPEILANGRDLSKWIDEHK